MKMHDFLRDLFEAGRFKHDQNLIDRKVIIESYSREFEIVDITVDYKGDISIQIDEVDK